MAESRSPQAFFSLNSQYIIDPQASPADLLNDAGCFLEAAIGLLQQPDDEPPTTMQVYAAEWLSTMARQNISAAQKREGLI